MAALYPKARVVAGVQGVLSDPEADAVAAPRHFDLARAALEAGKHSHVEKPMTLSSLEALEAAAPLALSVFTCTVPEPADAIIADVDGTLTRSFYQAEKSIKNSEDVVCDGGTTILQARCAEGLGMT